MTSRDFCYWLQGFFEISSSFRGEVTTSQLTLSSHQVDMIKKHLALVFKHEIDPSYGDADHQKILNEIHNAAKGSGDPMPVVDPPKSEEPKKETPKPSHHCRPPAYRC